jgi:hypothetical protein
MIQNRSGPIEVLVGQLPLPLIRRAAGVLTHCLVFHRRLLWRTIENASGLWCGYLSPSEESMSSSFFTARLGLGAESELADGGLAGRIETGDLPLGRRISRLIASSWGSR